MSPAGLEPPVRLKNRKNTYFLLFKILKLRGGGVQWSPSNIREKTICLVIHRLVLNAEKAFFSPNHNKIITKESKIFKHTKTESNFYLRINLQ